MLDLIYSQDQIFLQNSNVEILYINMICIFYMVYKHLLLINLRYKLIAY